ncbi:TetR/AcrR family transcriptional repressor of nem operon [Bradyrhizobium diazoefficiens]
MRPREFDHDDVLRIAFDRFWRKGVRGTSLSDIARDAGVQRGSLYNAFGSKEALFLQAYERYAGDYLLALQKALGAGSLRKRLTAFFDLTIVNFRSGSPPRGCPTTRGLMELGAVEGEGLDEDARQAFANLISRITALVQDTLSAGAKRGEFNGKSRGRSAPHHHGDARPRRARTGLRRRRAAAQDRVPHDRSRARQGRRLGVSSRQAR